MALLSKERSVSVPRTCPMAAASSKTTHWQSGVAVSDRMVTADTDFLK